MTRLELVRRLAEFSTRPVSEIANGVPAERPAAPNEAGTELFVWFEDTSGRRRNGRRGVAGLPESLMPCLHRTKVLDRRFTEGHLHLLSAVRVRCSGSVGEPVAAIYTAALSVGTVAWIGSGAQYEAAWNEMFPYSAPELRTPRWFKQ
jgi:hypothetical protein